MRNKRFRKKSGFILLPVVLAMFIIGLLGVGLASMYSGTFSTLQAGQVASQAKQYANIEAAAIKARGYDDAESGAHGWQDMTSLVGSEDGSKWQSKVETMRTDTTPDGNNVKVMKVSTRKNGELVSRYSEEIPVVEGLDVYNKDEIDSMFSTVDHQIGTLTTDLTNLTTRMTNAESSITNLSGDINTINSNIDSINADLDTLQKMINANTSLINEETSYRKTADTNLQNNINKEANARTSAVNAINLQINSLKSTLSNLQGALTSEANARKASDSTLQSNINSEASARAKAIQDLAAEVNNKYTELKNLYDGIKGRLDGKEFVRSKDAANNISLKYEQLAGEDKKSIHAYVDGNLVPLASQNANTSQGSNIGIPDYSKIISIAWPMSGKWTGNYVSLPNLVNLDLSSTYVIPNDGWIIWTKKTTGNGVTFGEYPVDYFINDVKMHGDTPIPVKKGDVISAYNSVSKNTIDAVMKFAPNR